MCVKALSHSHLTDSEANMGMSCHIYFKVQYRHCVQKHVLNMCISEHLAPAASRDREDILNLTSLIITKAINRVIYYTVFIHDK